MQSVVYTNLIFATQSNDSSVSSAGLIIFDGFLNDSKKNRDYFKNIKFSECLIRDSCRIKVVTKIVISVLCTSESSYGHQCYFCTKVVRGNYR